MQPQQTQVAVKFSVTLQKTGGKPSHISLLQLLVQCRAKRRRPTFYSSTHAI